MLRTGVTRQVADALGAANVATLRYDKRGIGASGGDYLRAGLTENLADARAALRWLAARFPACRCSRWGTARVPGTPRGWRPRRQLVAGTVLLGAPARTGEEIINWQIAALAPTLPRPVRLFIRLTGQDFEQDTAQAGRLA